MVNFFLPFGFLLMFVSCKKKEKENQDTTTNPGTTTNQPANVTMTAGLPSSGYNGLNGVFTVNRFYSYNLGTTLYVLKAGFLDAPSGMNQIFIYGNAYNMKDSAGIVVCDTDTLSCQGSPGSYFYTKNSFSNNFLSSVDWSISGNGNFSPFSATVAHNLPYNLSYQQVPDSIDRNQNFSITISSDIQEADSIVVSVNWPGAVFRKSYPGNVSQIGLTTAEMNSFSAGNVELVISARNFSYNKVNSKLYLYQLQSDNSRVVKFY